MSICCLGTISRTGSPIYDKRTPMSRPGPSAKPQLGAGRSKKIAAEVLANDVTFLDGRGSADSEVRCFQRTRGRR